MEDKKALCRQLAEQIGAGESKYVPGIFETMVDEAEARLLLAASPPGTVADLADRSGLDATAIESMIDPLFRKGLLFKSKKPEGTRYYRVRHLLQFHDASAVMHDPPPGMLGLWKKFMDDEWEQQSRLVESILPHPVLRIVPINVMIEPETRVLALDDVSRMLEGARTIAVTKCSCRAIDGACGNEVDVCLQLDRAADYSIERGTGRPITQSEALRILRRCESQGLVHVTENKQALGNVICNCCRDCCINWASVRTGLGKFVSPSRLRARVAADECDGCELCIDRCFFDALSMQDGDAVAAVDEKRCMGCGICRAVCANDAIHMDVVYPQEFIPAA